jgi:hypothetical protein
LPLEAVTKGVLAQAEGDQLAAAHDAVAKVIGVDDFAPEALSPTYKKPADVHQFFQELGETSAVAALAAVMRSARWPVRSEPSRAAAEIAENIRTRASRKRRRRKRRRQWHRK